MKYSHIQERIKILGLCQNVSSLVYLSLFRIGIGGFTETRASIRKPLKSLKSQLEYGHFFDLLENEVFVHVNEIAKIKWKENIITKFFTQFVEKNKMTIYSQGLWWLFLKRFSSQTWKVKKKFKSKLKKSASFMANSFCFACNANQCGPETKYP